MGHVSRDRAARLDKVESEQALGTKETPVYHHNVATMWEALKSQVGSPVK